MIDSLTAQSAAMSIGLSSVDTIQKLGVRLAHILSAELSRQRADLAFANSTGAPIHSPAAHQDGLRAQQVSVTGFARIGLTLQAELFAEGSLTAAHHVRQHKHERVDGHDPGESGRRHPDGAELAESEEDDVAEPYAERHDADDEIDQQAAAALKPVLQQTLVQFRTLASEAGFSGSPVAVVLPAQGWIKACAPADICQSVFNGGSDRNPQTLVLCLAFDGTLGRLGLIMGLIFQGDCLIGSLRARWSSAIDQTTRQAGHTLDVLQENAIVSDIVSGGMFGQVRGFRVKIDEAVEELARWCWQVDEWSWH